MSAWLNYVPASDAAESYSQGSDHDTVICGDGYAALTERFRISEIVFVGNVLDASDRTKLLNYLCDKWALDTSSSSSPSA